MSLKQRKGGERQRRIKKGKKEGWKKQDEEGITEFGRH
jgi:hypothetical protein